MKRMRRLGAALAVCVLASGISFAGRGDNSAGQRHIKASELRDWVTHFSSDDFEGRSTYSEGLGLAAAWLAEQMKDWGVRPGGDNGSYFQRVRVLGVKSTNRSSITVENRGEKRTFENGEAVDFQPYVGSNRSFTSESIRFSGYGVHAPTAGHDDYASFDPKGSIVVWLGASGPKTLESRGRGIMLGRSRYATVERGALASIGQDSRAPRSKEQQSRQQAPQERRRGYGPPIERPDFTTAQKLDSPVAPSVNGRDEFFEFLLKGQKHSYAALRDLVEKRQALPVFQLEDVKITFDLKAEYRVVRTQYTRNVVGVVQGSDPKLRNTYVAYGAHYDHVGYSEGEVVQTSDGARRAEPPGRVRDGALEDRFWNGADDDTSGTIAVLAAAKAFALGPKPRRSAVFVFHTGEERGLYGSRYFADYPTVPIESIIAEINLDMVGRNREDREDEADTVYPIGSDRISTELHNHLVETNRRLTDPLKLDFELNDPTDPEQFYFRSDHYSYAAKGIPVVFLTTGLHADYHANTDSADKINYGKMERITRLAYQLGFNLAGLKQPPARDLRGPRAGKAVSGKIAM